jgi:hypothetical protein
MKKILLLLSFVLLSTNSGFAWGHLGHSLVAEVAFNNLDAKTKQNVLKYLDGMSIEEAANWMDAMRSDKSYNYMKPYHYIDFERGAGVTELSGDNIINVLNMTLKDLDNIKGLSNDEVRTRLYYLFHLIGDLHMPLHVGYKDDKGGNSVQVSFFGRNTNLHAMWDSDIIEYKNLTLADLLKTNSYKPNELSAIKQIDITGWAKDSRKYLKNVYGLNEAKVTDIYVDANYPIIEQQILKAGLRLASVLEHYFKDVEYKQEIKTGANIKSTSTTGDVIEGSIEIDVTKASEYEGKLVYICSKVYSTKVLDSNGMTFLNVGADYPDSPLTVVIYSDKLQNFSFKPSDYYKGKTICIIGRIKIYKGKPEIISNSEHDIFIK